MAAGGKSTLRIRLETGKTLTETFDADVTLGLVKIWVDSTRTDRGPESYSFVQAAPHRVFGDEDMEKTLIELGLIPNAALNLRASPSSQPTHRPFTVEGAAGLLRARAVSPVARPRSTSPPAGALAVTVASDDPVRAVTPPMLPSGPEPASMPAPAPARPPAPRARSSSLSGMSGVDAGVMRFAPPLLPTGPSFQPGTPPPRPAAVEGATTRLKIRLTDGSVLQETFPTDATMEDVKGWVDAYRTDPPCPFDLVSVYPAVVFDESRLGVTLMDAGLVPQGQLNVRRHGADLVNGGNVHMLMDFFHRQGGMLPSDMGGFRARGGYHGHYGYGYPDDEEYSDGGYEEGAENLDHMSYEQLLALEEQMGSVSRGLSKEDIVRLPQTKYEKGPDEETCPVCMEEYATGQMCRTLPCTHFYHRDCIDQWLKDSRECPICKHDVLGD